MVRSYHILLVILAILFNLNFSFYINPIIFDNIFESKRVPSELYAKKKIEPDIANCPKVFIGNLPFDATESDLLQHVQKCAGKYVDVKKVTIAVGKKDRPRGFGFVDFEDYDTAHMIAERVDGSEFSDRILNSNVKVETTDKANMQKVKRDNRKTIFVANLPKDFDEIIVGEMCEDILGPNLVRSIQMPRDRITGNSRCMAFIEFYNADLVERAIEEFNELNVLDRVLFCERCERKIKVPTQIAINIESS